jgi:hypothetical protein
MIDQELSSRGISEVKRRMLQVHKHAPSINVNILSYKNQQVLKEMFRGSDAGLLNMDGLFSQFGAPGFLYPSDNAYKLGRKNADRQKQRCSSISKSIRYIKLWN